MRGKYSVLPTCACVLPEQYFVFTCCIAGTRKRKNFDPCAYACVKAIFLEIRIIVFALVLAVIVKTSFSVMMIQPVLGIS